MCRYCAVDGSCSHEVRGANETACACSLSGPSTCPVCGHDCEPWYSRLEIPGQPNLATTIAESDFPVKYPAPRARILQYLSGPAGLDPTMLAWIAQRLPETQFRDPGEVIKAILPPIEWTDTTPGTLLHRVPLGVIATGSRLVVRDGQKVVLVDSRGQPYDVFAPGTTTLSRENAPLAAAISRAPAPGFSSTALEVEPVFVSTRDLAAKISYLGPTKSRQPVALEGRATVRVDSPQLLLRLSRSSGPSLGTDEATALVQTQATSWARESVATLDLAELKSSPSSLEGMLRDRASKDGLTLVSLTIDSVGEPTADALLAHQMQRLSGMPNLPPEVAAMVSARMAAAGRTPPAVQARPSSSVSPAPGGPPVLCASCHAPNPPSMKFCGNCGKPLAGKRTCPSCGREVPPTVKFCGNCGAKLG